MSDGQDTKSHGSSTADDTKLPSKNSKQSKRDKGYRIWIELADVNLTKCWFAYTTYQKSRAEAYDYGVRLVRQEYYGNRKFTGNDDFVKYLEVGHTVTKLSLTPLLYHRKGPTPTLHGFVLWMLFGPLMFCL